MTSGEPRCEERREGVALRAPSHGRARLEIVERDGVSVLRKDFADHGGLFRRTAGAWMARREIAAYRRLSGVRGIPRLLGRVAPDGILLEYLPAKNCREPGVHVAARFFDDLRALLREVRGRGVLHGDIRRNVLCSLDGAPALVDFGSSFVLRGWPRPLRTRILALAARYDDRAVLKLEREIAPTLLAAEDWRRLEESLPFEGVLKLLRRGIARFVELLLGSPPALGRS
jgi:hypothetical protein